MPMLEDGGGSAKRAFVNEDKRLATEAVILSPQCFASLKRGHAFQAVSGVQTVATAGAYGLLALRNNSSDIIAITYIRIGVNRVEVLEAQAEITLGGTWVDGTAASLYNTDQKNTDSPNATVHYNSLPTGSNSIDVQWGSGPTEMTYNKEGAIILKRSAILALKVTTATDNTKLHGRISFFVLPLDVYNSIRRV
jgi:hypothetical protein